MSRLPTVYLMTCAVIGIAGALVLAPANWMSTVLFATIPFASVSIAGLWILPAVVALRLLQRPGAGLAVGLVSGLALMPVSGYGYVSVVTNLWWALFAELFFLLLLYRRWSLWQHYAGAVVLGIVYPALAWASYDLGSFTPLARVAFFALTMASCIAGTALGLAIAAGLRHAGVAAVARRRTAR